MLRSASSDWRLSDAPQQTWKGGSFGASTPSPPSINLPKGGGAIKGLGEKFTAGSVTGTGTLSVPVPWSPGRSGFTPSFGLFYDSGIGNGPFGFGWSIGLANITRRTDRGLPRYLDGEESDVFILSGAEDLVPARRQDGTRHEELRDGYRVTRYRPRIEGAFARIERWLSAGDPADCFWRSISRDNVTTLYGDTPASRIADPADPARIFSWLVSRTFDDKGNAAAYDYIAEDSRNVDLASLGETNRDDEGRTANRYLKRVCYANRKPVFAPSDFPAAEWLLEMVLDYGDHEGPSPTPEPDTDWPMRPDSFSSYRSGFEIRTYRRCRRFLMFHRFAELGPAPRLVRSLALDHDDFGTSGNPDARAELAHAGSTALGSFLRRVTLTGYADDGLAKAMPPLELTYSRPEIHDDVRTLDEDSYRNLPLGAEDARHEWLDLDGEGLPGILSLESDAWWFKPNLGDGRLGPQQPVALRPNLSIEHVQFMDLAGDGSLDAVQLDRPLAGFHERTDDRDWSDFLPFPDQPNINWADPNLRLVDLTGDGHADILITEDEVISWHPSLAEDGFGVRRSFAMAPDEGKGPRLVFNDTTETVFLADMSGDGLSDLVRIRNGEICYWPNLGYGRFGRRISMENAPVFEEAELFEPKRLRLADIDGSGVSDILYVSNQGLRLYFNRSGNGWTEGVTLSTLPRIDNLTSVGAVDLLGTGTACLVWSSPLPEHSGAPLRFVDLLGSVKPHLLVGVENNLGARTLVRYASSVKFYLADEREGRPWVTHLPFPVQVVERVETFDAISRNRFVTRFAYHHGYFDGVEREFRGFGLVEQWDTEEFEVLAAAEQPPAANIDLSSHVPPVLTRSWFHTGIHLGAERVSSIFAGLVNDRDLGEYYREPGLDDGQARALLLADTVLPPGLSVEEEREACRALKGIPLRQEIYALDGSEREPHPYFVSEQNFSLKRLQEKGDGRHAVFLPIPRESLAYYYERDPSDPRVAHELTLEVDEFGNIRRSATVTYGRRRPDPGLDVSAQEIQAAHHVVYAEADVTNSIDAPDAYRGPSPFEQRAYEVTGLAPPPGDTRFAFENLLLATRDAAPLPYEAEPAPGLPQKRLIACGRTLYRGDDLAPLPSGRLDPLALPLESYSLALTPGLVSKLFGGRVSEAMLEAGGYVHNEGDNNWWVPSGRIRFAAEAEPEFATARAHFFLPRQYIDPFGHGTAIAYDGYDLLLQDMQDAVGNRTSVGERDASGNLLSTGNDYRVLQPCLITDENGNREAVRFDALGFVAGTAVMGKRDETPRRGDLLEGFVADLPDASVIAHLSNPLVDPEGLLGRATARIVYDLFAYFRSKHDASPKPSASCTIVRETHDADLAPGDRTRVQQSFSYFDGLGRMAQTKAQAEPGPVPRRDPTTGLIVLAGGEPQMTTEDVSPRWVASGWNVLDNKGALARQYEPFFSDRHGYEADTRVGASAVLFHDPLSRPLGVLRADHSWEKTKSGPWRQETWDANDTSLVEDPTGDSDLGGFFRRLQSEEYLPTWREQRLSGALGSAEQTAAEKAAAHAATPSVSHSDSLGRTFLTVVHNKTRRSNASPGDPALEELLTTRLALDIEGNVLEAIDASDRTIMRYGHDMLGRRLHQASMDAGERWALLDVMGKLIHAWDGRGHVFRTEYDALRRHLNSFVKGADPQDPDAEILFAKTEYGEGQPDDAALNLRGNPVRQHDGAGLVTSDAYDFKGNLLRGSRRLARHYEKPLDWRADPELETEVFTSSTSYDALGRAAAVTAPDGSVSEPQYNIRGLLERLDTRLAGTAPSTFVAGAEYSARGQRIAIHYGNGIETRSSYDRLTMRLRSLRSTRTADQALLQALSYTYDSVGNPTHIEDEAQDAIHFANQAVTAASDYTYDAIYRLISAEGREHIGQAAQPQTTWNDAFRRNLPHPGDGQAMRRYSEQYSYDPAGNLLELAHAASGGNWTRAYRYQEVSALEAGKTSNRLSDTSVSGAGTEAYGHDAHGNITAMPHLPVMLWDFKDQLAAASRQPETASDQETTYFVHDWTGRRMRKVTNRRNGSRKCERLYLGGFEIYREYAADGTTVTLERQSLHVLNGSARVALVETLTQGGSGPTEPAVRYQCGNHLESATLELDAQGQVITYEEFYPFGGTSYQAGRSTAETSLKRYRFTAKERDEETGFTDHGARAYAPWLGRWISADPAGLEGGWNLYAYAMNAPVHLVDHTGTDGRIPSRCFDRFNDGQDKIYNPSRCGPITKWKGRRRAPSRGDADGDGGQKRTRRKSSSSGSEDGEAGGVEGGSAGGVQGGRAGATGAVGGKKGGVGMKPGTGTTGSGDTGEGKEGGDSGNPGNDKGSGGSSDKPGNPGGEAKNEGGEGKEAGGKKGGDTQGKQEGPQEGDPGEPGKNPGESTALGTLAQVAALIDDPESLYEAQQSGNKGTGAQMGRKNGLIGGKLGQLLSVIAVFGMVFIGKIGDFFKKIGGGFKKAWNKLFKKEAKQIEKRAVDLLSDYSQKMHSLMGGGLEGAKDFTKKAPTMEIPGDLTVDDLLKYRAMSVEAQEAAAKAEKYTGRYAGDVHDERIVGIDILLERMGHKF